MDPNSLEVMINILAGTATVITFIVSIVQTIRFQNAQSKLEVLRRSRNATIWHNIEITLSAYETIEDAKALVLDDKNPHQKIQLYAKISSARRSIVNQYLQLLKEAILDEDNFTEETIEEWKKSGRLENEWRVSQARKFVRPKVINGQKKQTKSISVFGNIWGRKKDDNR